jgi:tetratricopeptide (TPR) repeat protein
MSKAPMQEFENLVSTLSIVTVIVVVALIGKLANSPDLTYSAKAVQAVEAAAQHRVPVVDEKYRQEVSERFEQAVAMLHAKQYKYAVTALKRIIELAPRMPEAYVNMGFALLGLEDYEAAGEYFNTATELRPTQANAYWGLGEALAGLKDYEGALGAMRSYIHLSTPDDPYLPRARAALWELEGELGRIPGVRPVPEDEVQATQKQAQKDSSKQMH